MAEYLFLFQIWLIIAGVLLALELFDTSLIIFLPLGLSGLVIAGWLYLTQVGVLTSLFMPNKWFWLVLAWIAAGLLFTILIARMRRMERFKPEDDEDVDVNQY